MSSILKKELVGLSGKDFADMTPSELRFVAKAIGIRKLKRNDKYIPKDELIEIIIEKNNGVKKFVPSKCVGKSKDSCFMDSDCKYRRGRKMSSGRRSRGHCSLSNKSAGSGSDALAAAKKEANKLSQKLKSQQLARKSRTNQQFKKEIGDKKFVATVAAKNTASFKTEQQIRKKTLERKQELRVAKEKAQKAQAQVAKAQQKLKMVSSPKLISSATLIDTSKNTTKSSNVLGKGPQFNKTPTMFKLSQ